MTYDILWHLMTIVAWSAFRFTRKAVFASKALSVSTKNLAGKVRIEMKQHENVSQLMVVRVSSCFGTESPTYDDAKEPLNNWRSNLNTLCYLPYMLIRITFHAKSYVMSLQFDHVTPRETFDNLWQKRPWTWLSPASAADSFSWRCFGWTAANLSVSFNPASRLAEPFYTSNISSSAVVVLRPGGRNGGFRGVNGASGKVKRGKRWAEIIKRCLHISCLWNDST